MSALQHLTRSNALTLDRPRYRSRPRISLTSGEPVGQSIRLALGVRASLALEIACNLAQDTGQSVSLAATGPYPELPNLVAAALSRAAVPPGHLELTVTDPDLDEAGVEALLALSALRDQGVGVALRGFGRGKIAIVPRLPLSAVILSSAIIRDIPGAAAATMMLHTLHGLARSQALDIVATGIATEPQRAILSGIGCHAGEGSLFGTSKLLRDIGHGLHCERP